MNNLYDISISQASRPAPKKKYSGFTPRRVGSASNLNDHKRPNEYYLSKISTSSTSLPKQSSRFSDLHVHADSCKDSDDASSVNSNPFDNPDSRLSSITMNTLYSNRASEASDFEAKNAFSSIDEGSSIEKELSAINKGEVLPSVDKRGAFSSIEEKSADDDSLLHSSISTVTLQDPRASASDLSMEPLRSSSLAGQKIKAASTSNVLESSNSHKLTRQMSESSNYMLTRSKTRFYNAKESKERKQLRKKVYEENDDDEILCNDLDLVFNVPVIKNNGDVYRSAKPSSSSSMLSRDDISESGIGKYPIASAASINPCPLPGKLSQSRLNLNVTPSDVANPVIPEDNAVNHSSFHSSDAVNSSFHSSDGAKSFHSSDAVKSSFHCLDNDSEICHNISEFYSQRSLSYSHTAKATRDQDLTCRLPNYVKMQTSTEELNFVSPEKLEVLDHTRPINLPPKNAYDKAKHGREMHKVLTDLESATKNQTLSRKVLNEQYIMNQQLWFRLMIDSDEKAFKHKLHSEKNKIRALSWESPISDKYRFEYFMRVLRVDLGSDFIEKVRESLPQLEATYQSLSPQIRSVKDSQFKQVIDNVLSRPLFANHLLEISTTENSSTSISSLKENFLHFLYLKSFSEGGLRKHQEVFVIPTFLMLFQGSQSLHDIYILMEMFESSIFESDVFASLNKRLACWKDLSLLSSSSMQHKILKRFMSLDEFDYLNSSNLFELIIQLNDKLPLSLSAPSTPVVAQNTFASLSKVSLDSESSGNSQAKPMDMANALESCSLKSSSMSLVGMFLQLIVIYSKSRYKKHNLLKLYQSFLLTIFKFYHINWNSYVELVQSNKSIKLNNSSDQLLNLESFVDKWHEIFKKM